MSAAYEVQPSLFCFASNPTSVSIGLESDIIEALAALGLDYEVDLYISDPAAAGHRHVRQLRQRLIDRFNSSVRRPGMYGSLQAETDIRDLAFIDRAERELESLGAKLRERGWLSATGFRGAVELTFGDLVGAESIGQAPLVEVGLKLGWLELDRVLERNEYWRLVNDSPGWLGTQQRTSGELEAEYGTPSIKIGGNGRASLGFGTNDPTLPLVWLDVGGEGRIASLRRSGDTILDEFVIGRPLTFDAVAAARSVEASRNASNPFDLRDY